MSAFSLPIAPPSLTGQLHSQSQVRPASIPKDEDKSEGIYHGTLRYHTLARIRSFGAWLEPRYIFAARQLI